MEDVEKIEQAYFKVYSQPFPIRERAGFSFEENAKWLNDKVKKLIENEAEEIGRHGAT